ncbi:MAG: gamma-glutamyl-gamma-aminobutyrate hydrolase family protein [Clostridia bacterium]|nr:gamma-glutamyl-gamma-aminobutyrate hydrolase family protein [Clostridia bacterium]
MKPIIGITAGYSYSEGKHFLTQYYTEVVTFLGGIPVILPAENTLLAAEFYNLVDGLIFSGGGDLDPFYFGEDPLRGIGEINPRRDLFELELAKIAFQGVKPVLGICRGMQLLNIAAGGDVYQDIREFTQQEHNQKAPKWYPWHLVNIAKGSTLYRLVGQEKIKVNSFHHQAVKKLGSGLKVVAWSNDNIIEALAGEDNQNILGVQWHPECSWDRDQISQEIFSFLINTEV